MQLIAANEWNKVWHEGGHKWRIQVRAELVHLDGNAKPHFSITGWIKYQAKNNRWVDMGGGAIHDEILLHFPKLAPLVAIHLADDEGVPMHSYANAAYWAGHTRWQAENLAALAKHLRINETRAKNMKEYIAHYWGELDAVHTPEMAWQDACNNFNLPEQWRNQAAEALALLNKVAVPA